MNGICRSALAGAGAMVLLGTLSAASAPTALRQVNAGLWEVVRPGAGPERLCVADPATLAQFEHRSQSCSRTVLRDDGSVARIHYTCPGGAFGDSKVTVLTPRSVRIETQGISDNAPFKYILQARRVGNCPGH